MRKSIFDIVSQAFSISSEVDRIEKMARREAVLYRAGNDYTLFQFVDKYCFKEWECRGHCVDVADYLGVLNFSKLKSDAQSNEEDFITLVELIYNFWMLAYKDLTADKSTAKWQNNFYHLRDVMLDDLAYYNHTAYVDGDRILVVEDKPEVTATVEIVKEEIALNIIRYNHRTLKGEIETKKTILLSLAAELEPKRKQLRNINNKLEDDIFFMLNNLNIRHNNRSKKDKNYKEYVAKMRKERLEKWYDELYQMMLLAILLLDNVTRAEDIKELRLKINGGQKNGQIENALGE